METFTGFTEAGAQRWAAIDPNIRAKLLANVWCSSCRHSVTISNYTGVLKGRDLLMVGFCSECRGDVARVIEGQ